MSPLKPNPTGGVLTATATFNLQPHMHGALLPGDSTTSLRSFAVPEPGWAQILLRIKSSTICGKVAVCYDEELL